MQEFEAFVRLHGQELVRFASAVTAEPALAEDVVQTVLLRMMGRWPDVAAARSPEAYVRRAVVNEYLSWRRKWSRLVPTATPPDRAMGDLADEYAERSALAHQVSGLPPRQRAALVLRFYVGCSDAEIADTLGCSQVTVRGYVSRALRTLRVELAATAERTGNAH